MSRSSLRRPRTLVVALVVTPFAALLAQAPAPAQARPNGAPPGGDIRGRLVMPVGGAPVTTGSISVRRGNETAFAGGTLPKADGSFIVDGLLPGRYTVRIRSLGYAPVLKSDVVITAEQRSVNLGTITLTPIPKDLAGVEITAEADEVQLSPERNSYATKNMTTVSGGTAIDALRQVPSVEVDATNKISLRGNENVVVQINGRTSPLRGEQLGNFIAQLPVSAVTRIEVATNPSAKDDPEGTAGILNIVLAQQVETGLSGGFTAGTASTGMLNLSGNIGKQSGPWTLFTSLSGMRDTRPFRGFSERANTSFDPAFANSILDGSVEPFSGNLLTRSEYKFTERDALSFDGMMSRGRVQRENDSYFTNLDAALDTLGLFNQYSDALSRNRSQDFTLAFRRTGPPATTTFSTELRHTLFNLAVENVRSSELLRADATTGSAAAPAEQNALHARLPVWTLQSDLTQPLGEGRKLEAGVKGTNRSLASHAEMDRFDASTNRFEPVAGRYTALDYNEKIAAVYGMYSQQLGRAQAQAGLRVEQTNTQLGLPLGGAGHDDSYASLFPSATLNFSVTPTQQAKVGYSRRITRPDAPMLDPAQFNEDSRTAFRGNPDLKPEYTDAVELGWQESRAWGSYQINPYLRQSTNAVRQIRTVNDSGVTIATFANVASTRTLGTDLNVNFRSGAVNYSAGAGAYDYRSEAGALSTHTFAWNARSTLGYTFSPVFDAQLQANYRAPQRVEGGRQLAFFNTNLALRRKLFGDAGNLTVRVADVFNSARFAVLTDNGRVAELLERRFGQRTLFISFSRTFGQALKLRPRQESDQSAPAPLGTP